MFSMSCYIATSYNIYIIQYIYDVYLNISHYIYDLYNIMGYLYIWYNNID